MADMKKDYYQEVTNEIIKAIEEGTTPWQQGWDSKVGAAILAELLDITAVGIVTRYLVDRSLASKSGMVFVENDSEEIERLVAELHEADSKIHSLDDVLTCLEVDCQKFPALRDSVDYHRPDEYIPGGEPLINCYTSISGLFIEKII